MLHRVTLSCRSYYLIQQNWGNLTGECIINCTLKLHFHIYIDIGAIQDAIKVASVTFTCEPIGLSSLGLLRRIPVCREDNTNE